MTRTRVSSPISGKRLKAGIVVSITLLLGTIGASFGLSGVAHGTSEAVGYPSGTPAIAIASTIGTAAQPQLADRNGNFLLAVKATNFTFDAATSGATTNAAGAGHYQIYLDHFDPRSAANSAKGLVTLGAASTLTISTGQLLKAGAAQGVHQLFAVLANNDRSLVPGAGFASTVIRIGPSLAIQENGTAAHPLPLAANGILTLHVRINDFTLDPADVGGASKPGFGHYHLYLDSFDPAVPLLNYVTKAATTSFNISAARLIKAGATPGIHTLFLVVANNDHTIVNPATGDSITIRLGS